VFADCTVSPQPRKFQVGRFARLETRVIRL
jgi:hypothetical protein